MCFTVCVAELPKGSVGVNLRCGESLMSEELPHAFDVGAVVQQGCGIAVTQHVRRALLEFAYEREAFLYCRPHLNCAHALSAVVGEECVCGTLGRLCVAAFLISAYGFCQFVAEGYDALLAALSHDSQFPIVDADVCVVQSDEFGESHSGFVERYYYCTRTYTIIVVAPLHLVEQPFHLVFSHELRQGSALLRSVDGISRVAADQSV